MGLTFHEMSVTIDECQVRYLEMLGTYPVTSQVRYLEMLGTYPVTSIHETVRY